MKRIFSSLFSLCLSTIAFSQETNVRFVANRETPVFIVKRIYVEEAKNLVSDLSLNRMTLELLTLAPSSIDLPNGEYLLNVYGASNFNRVFALEAKGIAKDVIIKGDPRKETLFGIIGLVAAGALVPSITAIVGDVDDGKNVFAGLGFYATLGSGALLATGIAGAVIEHPRVIVKDR